MGIVVGLLMGWARLEIWGKIYILGSVFFLKNKKYVHTLTLSNHAAPAWHWVLLESPESP
jgi:hypothetical protein